MSILNQRLKLELLSRQKGVGALQQGFTLVELMIVIVIVGILSSVALPNFLSQTDKAKTTEATTKIGSLLREAYAEYQYDGDVPSVTTALTTSASNLTTNGNFTFTLPDITAPSTIFTVKATGKTAAAGGDAALDGKVLYGCIDLAVGTPDISNKLLAAGTATDLAADCT
ncbi:type IV pilin protein [Prochlorococcus sp. MIT 1303]|uniref:type IV pilin protein n=1 Tax=Prochlorococcus sp. MIT 1303 TaxID=1723647 RepID=UPI0007B3504F|nr:type II secretion system protein [Prochlorococcus sp. MIT 1303]KZR65752.1 Fimbrial protein precursor [Prochlorococcus sp. MIT 1303]